MMLGNLLSFFPLSCAALWDFKRRIIPDWTVFLIFSCAALNIALKPTILLPSLFGMVAVGLPICLAATKWGEIGGGDVKLCAALGALLGLEKTLTLLIVALVSLTISGKIRRQQRMPFAPYVWGAFYILLASEILQRSWLQ